MNKAPNKETNKSNKEIEKLKGNCSQNEHQIDINKSNQKINSTKGISYNSINGQLQKKSQKINNSCAQENGFKDTDSSDSNPNTNKINDLAQQNEIKENEENHIQINTSEKTCKELLLTSNILQKKSFEDIVNDINNLINSKVIIENIVPSGYFTENDFQIMNRKEPTKLPFIINLSNFINILNYLLEYSNNDRLLFHNLLKNIGIKFSYVERGQNNILDYGFCANISPNIIAYILSKGESGFGDNNEINNLAKLYCKESMKNQKDISYLFENSNREYLFREIDCENFQEYPSIVYYLKKSVVQKLYRNGIFNTPTKYSLKDESDDNSEYSGFNKLDICIKIKKDVSFKQNSNFNVVNIPGKKIIKDYDINNKEIIEFKSKTFYLFKIKMNIEDLTRNENEILIKSQRKKKTFAQLFKNKVFDKLEDEIFANCELLFICDQKREKVVKNIIENKIKENFLYSNANISLNVIASLNQGIYKINVQNKRLEKDINILKNDVEKLKDKVNALSSNKRNAEENLERLSIILDKMRISKVYVDLNLEDILANKIQSCKDRIGAMAITFDECSTEYFKISNEAGIFIGNVINFIIEDDKRKQLKEFLDSFENEINKAHFKKYFIAIKEMIFGTKFTESPQNLSFIISLDNMDVVQKFLSYVYFLESKSSNEFIELKFSIALLNIGIQLYGNKLNSLIKESSKDISLVNENIIRYVNKNNIF